MSNSTSTTSSLPTPTSPTSPTSPTTTTTTSSSSPPTSSPTTTTTSSPTSSSTSPTNPNPTTVTTSNPITSSSTSISLSDTSTSESPTTTSAPESTSSTPPPTTTTSDPPTSTTPESTTEVTPTDSQTTVTVHSISTSTSLPGQTATATGSSSPTETSSSSGTSGTLQPTANPVSHGLSQQGTIAVAVVVPIVAVALILVALLFLWRRRKARKDAEELRRKEVEEYGYNPNNDPTLPAVGGAQQGAYEMREEGSSGYRGWGTTASGRNASGGTPSGTVGMAYSDAPSGGPGSDTRSDNALMGEGEALGAMGPAATGNRGDINRGASNASSSYSTANRSDGSGEVMQSGGAYYSNQYDTGNPYGDAQYGNVPGGHAEVAGQPVIRDVEARRNTRIENPSHFPQQSAGISQNF